MSNEMSKSTQAGSSLIHTARCMVIKRFETLQLEMQRFIRHEPTTNSWDSEGTKIYLKHLVDLVAVLAALPVVFMLHFDYRTTVIVFFTVMVVLFNNCYSLENTAIIQ